MYRSIRCLFFADQKDSVGKDNSGSEIININDFPDEILTDNRGSEIININDFPDEILRDNSGSEIININDFPDEILTHILSFLPFKHAVRTTILSQRWRPLFHSLAVLNIYDERTYSKEYWYGFRQFMDKNMFPPHSQHITLKSFHLRCDHKRLDARADSSSLNNWIIAAKQRGIEDLNLLYYDVLLVPTTLFCCKTLVVLKLGHMHVAPMNSCSVDLPSLKTLDLYNVCFHNMENVTRLISGCPKLENLKTYVRAKVGVMVRGGIHLNPLKTYVEFKPLSKLIKADIHLCDVPLKAVCNVQFLSIAQMGKIVYNKEIKSYYKGFPVFENLTDLKLEWWHEEILDWDDVVKMLQNCSKLQTLKIAKCGNSTTKKDWKYPNYVPECVSSHLTTCKIEGYEALNADFQFATYILKEARVLQDMSIFHSYSYHPELIESPQYLEGLFSCTRISRACDLNVSGLGFPN